VILNENVGWHGMYLGRRRRRRPSTQAQKPVATAGEMAGGVRPDPNGWLAEKCAWMRLRQAETRGRKRV
jgi:hypothetical protein